MKRRAFLGTTAGTAAALSGITGCETNTTQTTAVQPEKPMAVCKDGTLAGKTLQELKDEYLYWIKDFTEFQHKYVIDKEYGGYMLHTDWDGPPITTEKTSWYEGRGTWTFSFLYNYIDNDPRNLEAARKSVEFIMKHLPTGDQFLPKSFTREGKPSAPDTDLYSDIFVANGFVEFSKTKGNEKYYDIAKDIVRKCVRMMDKPGYNASKYTPNGARHVGHWFVLVKTCTDMLGIKDDPEMKALADRCIESQMKYHYNPDYHLYNEELNLDFTLPKEFANRANLGHGSEVLWMSLNELVRRKDKALFDENVKRFKRNLEVSWDDVYGGVFIGLNDVEKNIFALGKAGWGQMEDLNGLMMIIEHTGADWAKEWFGKLYTWVMANFPLKPYGLPLWQDYTGRKAEFVKGNNGRRAENYHQPRQLMLNLLATERIMKRNGAVSGIFG